MARKQNNRSGYSKITSVSVSKEMLNLIDKNNLSPTEIFRNGLGVTFYENGIAPYSGSIMNKKRSEEVQKFIVKLKEAEELDEFIGSIKDISRFSSKIQLVGDAVNDINIILKQMGISK